MLLTIGLVYKQRVIPLVWMVYRGRKGHSSAEKQLALLEQLIALLPENASVILTGAAAFDGTEVGRWLSAHPNWDYAVRTAKNILVRAPHGDVQLALEEIAPPPGESQLLTNLSFTQHEIGPVNIAFLWNEKEAEHLYLVTSAQTLEEAQTWYRRRFKIETLFSDTKSRGFGLDKSGIRHPERMARFVIAIFLAYIWMIYLGVRVIQDKKLGLVARTDRFMYSLFQLGRFYLDRILEECWGVEAEVLVSGEPLSFWGGYEAKTGEIIDRRHPLAGRNASGRILAVPFTRGSSTTTAILLEAVRCGTAPAAIVTSQIDAFLALASIVADELYGKPIPVVAVNPADFAALRSGQRVELRSDGILNVL